MKSTIQATIDNPYIVQDYPYGFKLRCQKAYWVETKKGHGQRLVTKTSNPKTGGWNKPKAEAYNVVTVLYLDDNGHVQQDGFTHYSSAAEINNVIEFYELSAQQLEEAEYIIKAKAIIAKAFERSFK